MKRASRGAATADVVRPESSARFACFVDVSGRVGDFSVRAWGKEPPGRC